MIRLLQLPWGLVATLLAASCLNAPLAAAGPSVNVAMKAAFPSPPYLIELLETAAQENRTSYFPLLDRIADGYFEKATTDRELYEKFLDLLQEDGHIITPEALSTFKLALTTRSAAPRIEAHYQYFQTAVEPFLQSRQEQCAEWALVGGEQYCSPSLDRSNGKVPSQHDRSLPFDIVLGNGPALVFYGDITSPTFGEFHKALAEKARKGEGSYRVRHRRAPSADTEALPVSGYGVELALKRTDYIVIDDRETDMDAPQKHVTSEVVLDSEEEVADLKPLSSSELSGLGLKAASFIMQSSSPFDTLLKLTQDFPKFSSSIAAHNASDDFVAEHQANRMQMVPQGMNVLWMNGIQLIERQIDAFTLVDMLRRERKLIHGVMDLGLTGKEAVSLLGHSEVATSKANDEAQRFDWRDEIEDGQVIIWLNNIEKDKRYEDFPSSVLALLQGGMPGQLPQIRRDIFNLVFPVDLSKPDDILLVVGQLQDFVKRKLPVRFGIVPLVTNKEAENQAKVAYHLLENYGLSAMMAYLQASSSKAHPQADKSLFDKSVKDRTPRAEATPLPYADVLQSEYHEKQVQFAQHWADRLGANSLVTPLFVDGIAIPRDKNWIQPMSQTLGMDLRTVQQGVYYGTIPEDAWLPGHFLEKAAKRRNVIIFPEDEKSLTVLDVNKLTSEHAELLDQLPVIEANPDSTKENWAALTLIADLSKEEGRKLAVSALQFRSNNPGVRLDIIHNPTDPTGAEKIIAALKTSNEDLAVVDTLELLDTILDGPWQSSDSSYQAALSSFLDAAGIKPGTNMVILNGRVVGPIATASQFTLEDFQQFFELEQANRILPVYKAIEDLGLGAKVTGPLSAAKVTSITALSTISDVPEGIFESAPTLRISAFSVWNSSYTAFEVGDESAATIHFVASLNPASEQGQRWVPILKVLSELDGVYMKIFLNPKDRLDELPIKRFYRHVIAPAPTFNEAGKVEALGATFKGLPSDALLNAGMDVPPGWLVSSKESIHDLDNIKLSTIKGNVDAVYELKNILIEGHSRVPNEGAPRGVQLMLGTEKEPHFADTIIMANLGYFQFKANPGFYDIQLKEGRSSDIYYIESIGAKGYNSAPGDEGTEVALMDFMGTTLYPRLIRKPGMQDEDVLEDIKAESTGGLMSKGLKFAEGILGGTVGKSKTKSVSDEEHAEINIFSVASGHLYERMLNIMMVSVMKHTNHTVKFWFIEQFLSPSFKEFIPHLAEEYGFKYEMVTYKWPHWLRQQKEKQREIWGYKILFLDVLFPLSLDKVIFVDADQIVRADMYDLVQLDLEGAPYGFTPMCDSRTEMEGFRFWKQGYWANYLRGKPYHISALYVVDLRRFRELAAGDRLRQQYHTLSADPNSLSNLDQDLPNHMQFVIPIKSLPQEWLWCETWCSDESLGQARTIDLCNNPLTKEPKLDRARRQVPEWTQYDEEIAAVDRRRKGLPVDSGARKGGGDGAQEVLDGERNTKSRRLEEPPETRTKDEL
ncbi:UDP-glucose [Pleurostoma richardsiae]|uniref:UDP-glucose n=1 Tax=Pleurostoma richardsiae TaxID=41990 RepID=A0AA38R3U4_9PEZI|nr:UDP-glucose [Pleurostoma richardsiae]